MNAFYLYRGIDCGVADRNVSAGPEPWLCLVLLALQAQRVLFRAKRRRDLLYVGATNGEWSSLRSERVYGRASFPAVWVQCINYKSGYR
jgi:hypothetical protein